MLALRLARGGRPLTLLRRLLVALAIAVVGFLLLAALSHALDHPQQPGGSLVRLVWCLAPLAAAAQFAASVARTDPGSRSLSALDTAGVGPARIPVLAAASTALSALLGSAVALVTYLHLRGQLASLPFDGAAVGLLAADRPLPVAATFVLLCVPPLAAAAAAAVATRPGMLAATAAVMAGGGAQTVPATGTDAAQGSGGGSGGDRGGAAVEGESLRVRPGSLPAAVTLPWGAAFMAAGLAAETYASRSPKPLSLSAVMSNGAPGVLGGWLLTALGLVLAGPGITQLCGRLLAVGRPGAVRLLAGRVLQQESARLGGPLGALCAVAAGGLAASELYGATPQEGLRMFGPLALLGAGLVVLCVTASALTAAAESRAARRATNEALIRLGTPRRLLRGAALLRATVVCVVMGALTWAVGQLAALPLTT